MWELFASDSSKGMYAYMSADPACPDAEHCTYTIDANWKPNTKYTLKAIVSGGKLKFYYNNTLNHSISFPSRSTLYFKTGDYCQSDSSDPSTDYCEVEIHAISVTHV